MVARFPEFATDPESYQAVMQKMLAERFHLAVKRTVPAQVLVVDHVEYRRCSGKGDIE